MSDEIDNPIKPLFLRIAGVLLCCSIVSQVYFFTVINGILEKEFSAIGVIEAIIEWIYLVGPSFFFAVVFFTMTLFCWGVSYFRKEQSPLTKVILGTIVLDFIVFMGITMFHYG